MLNDKLNAPCSLQCGSCIFTNICMLKTLKSIKSNLGNRVMKARVKATGVIVNVQFLSKSETFTKYIDSSNIRYLDVELDFSDLNAGPEDYWERLKHQYAGMAMQTILEKSYNEDYHTNLIASWSKCCAEEVARLSVIYANALVEKLKSE